MPLALTQPRVAVNPLPWFSSERGIYVDRTILVGALADIAATPLRRVQADYPADMSVEEYLDLMAQFGLVPAPGYFSAPYQESDRLAEFVERAKAHAALQLRLGNQMTYVAQSMTQARIEVPAVGAPVGIDLDLVIEGLAAVAEAITAEGVRPCLHPHVGTAIETEAETRAVLDGISPSALWFGPDTGHLFWAGADVVALFADYADRIAGVHLKDVHASAADGAKAAGEDFGRAVFGRYLWTEPGRGDVPLVAALEHLPATFDGVMTIEVDRPDATSPRESTLRSAAWVAEQFGPAAMAV